MGLLKKRTAWDKAHRKVWRQEEKFLRRYEGKEATKLERKIGEIAPEALVETLHSAFCKAFEVVFEKGTGPILKAAGIEKRRIDYAKNACAADLKEDKKNLKAFSKAAGKAGAGNVLLSGAAGIGMGAFGVMLPDVPLFTAMLLKSVYETAESFGYRAEDEKIYALRLINAALTDGPALRRKNAWLDGYAREGKWPAEPELKEEIRRTARALSEAVLYCKVVQNIPVVGAVGGAANGVVLGRVQRYAAIKYQKRFLIQRRLASH